MASSFTFSSQTNPFLSQSSPTIPQQLSTKYHIKIKNPTSKSPTKQPKILPFVRNLRSFSFQQAPRSSKQQKDSIFSNGYLAKSKESVIQCIAKPIVYTLFCIAIGFSPIGSLQVGAITAPVATEERLNKRGSDVKVKSKDHEYSDYTRKLLETVSGLLRCIEEVRRGNGDGEEVGLALKDVKAKKSDSQDEIMSGMYREVKELKREKEGLVKRAEEIVDEVVKVRREYEGLAAEVGKEKERVEGLEEKMRGMEEEYSEVWEKVGDIEDRILRRETVAMSIGVRELCFIERECEELVQRFSREMRRNSSGR